MPELRTDRLRLVAADAGLAAAQAEGAEALGAALGVAMPEDWPPQFNTPEAARYVHDKLTANPEHVGWWSWYVVLDDEAVGIVGAKGPPVDGTIEVGYSVVASRHRQGIASEAVTALIGWAAERGATAVEAATLPELAASIGVLEKLGFERVESPAPEQLRFRRAV